MMHAIREQWEGPTEKCAVKKASSLHLFSLTNLVNDEICSSIVSLLGIVADNGILTILARGG